MKVVTLFLLIVLAAVYGDVSEINKEFLDGYNKFTGDVYTKLKAAKSGNFLVSPFSVDILLALLENGSSGETSKQLVKGLHLPENREIVTEAFSALAPKLNVNDKYTLTSANKIYVHKDYPLLQDFQKLAENVYRAEIKNINFEDKESATNEMNRWVEQKTLNKIKNLVSKEDLNEDTRAVLINALYFHGNWITKFDKTATNKDDFYLDKSSKIQVDLMQTKHNYRYSEDHELHAKFLELPYDGGDVIMTIVLPDEKDGLTSLENNILKVIEAPHFRTENVLVKLPKFKIESKIDFNDILKQLGIVNAFEDYAELSKITGQFLKISKVFQKSFIEVEEEGTTAAAATFVSVQLVRSGHFVRDTKEFIADHPFIFYLKYKSTILFIGRYTGQESH